jgi:hypothetical protein
MKDITLLFSIALVLVLGLTTLDGGLEKMRTSMAANATIGLPGFYASHQTALLLARHEKKPTVLVFGRPTDPACQAFKSQVLLSAEVHAIKDQFIWAFIDADQPANAGLLQTHGVTLFPDTCVLDQRDLEIKRIHGKCGTYEFTTHLREVLDLTKSQSLTPE